MKVCLSHNWYGRFSGEEAVVEGLAELLHAHGHEVFRFLRSSAEIPNTRLGKVRALLRAWKGQFRTSRHSLAGVWRTHRARGG